jgi:hypothetical protein
MYPSREQPILETIEESVEVPSMRNIKKTHKPKAKKVMRTPEAGVPDVEKIFSTTSRNRIF